MNALVRRLELASFLLRSFWLGEIPSRDPALSKLFGPGPTATGVTVTEWTALNYSAVWAAVTLIASTVGSLPLILYKREKGGGKERAVDHPLYPVLHDEPNPEMPAMVFRETLQAHLLTWGNAYAEIERDEGGRVKHLWPMTPDRVTPFRADGSHEGDELGPTKRVRYKIDNLTEPDVFLEANEVLHVPGLGFDGLVGYSVVRMARESIGMGLATEKFGGTFFGSGATFGGILSHPKSLSQKAKDSLRESIAAQHQGVERAHKFLILQEGMTYQKLGVDPESAQFLETRMFQTAEIARWFNLPPHKLKDLSRSTNNNIEHQGIEFYVDCIRQWLVRWEQEVRRKLLTPTERKVLLAEHLVEAILRGDSAARADFYAKLFGIGSFSINQILARENLDPIGKDGDARFVPANMITLERALEPPKPKPEEPKPTPTPKPDDDDARGVREQLRQAEADLDQARQEATQQQERADLAETIANDAIQRMQVAHGAIEEIQAARVHAESVALIERTRGDREAQKRGRVETEAATLQQRLVGAEAAAAMALNERDAARTETTVAAERVAQADAQVAGETARADQAQQETTAVRTRVAELERLAEDLRQQVADGQAAVERERQTRTEAEARTTQETMRAGRADEDLAAERQAHEATRREVVAVCAERDELGARLAAAATEHSAGVAALRTTIVEREGERDTARVGLQELSARVATLEEQLAQRSASFEFLERQAAEQRVADSNDISRVTTELSSMTAARDAVITARDTAIAAMEAAQARLATLDGTLGERDVQIMAIEAQAAAARTAAAEDQASRTEADRERDAALAREYDAIAALAVAEARASAAEAARQVADAARVDQLQGELARLTATLTAHRELIVDAMGRMVRRETEKARRQHGTPEKLRAWIEAFYITHEDTCVEALLPAVRVHLAWTQSADDAHTITRALMREHVNESVRQLRAVANGDPEDLHVTLERMLQRWEEDRPAALADRILREEVEYVRSYRV